MPRVIRILNRFNLGGPTYNAALLTKYMAPEFETLLIGGVNDKTEKNSEFIVKSLGLKPFIIPEMKRAISPVNDIIAYTKLKAIIRKFKPDIVHTHASKAGALGRRAALSLKVPVIIHTFHGHVFDAYFSSAKTSIYKQIERSLAEKTTKIIAISENQKNDLVNKFHICPEEKVEIIPLGFDLSKFQENMPQKRELFRKNFNIDSDEIAIGIVGRIVPIKNHKLFIKAVKYVAENSDKKVRAFIVGDGESRSETEEYAKSLGINYTDARKTKEKALLAFTSWQKDVDFTMAGMDIIALTSLNEGTPVSLIEAQAAGKPIVSTNVGGIENVIIPDKTALLSDIKDESGFLKNLLSVVKNSELRLSMSQKGWDIVKDRYHYLQLVKNMKNLYYKLLDI